MSQLTETSLLLGSLLGDKKSHPGKLLIEHLRSAADFAKRLAKNQKLQVDEELLSAIALTHDIGKVDQRFQRLLEGRGPGANHSKPSAWFTYSITNNLWAAEIVCRHHTHLRNIDDIIADWVNDESYIEVMERLLPDWPYPISEETISYFQDDYLFFEVRNELNSDLWLTTRLLYSLFISADRMDAIGVKDLSLKKMPKFNQPLLLKRSRDIDKWREKIKEICLEKASEVNGPGVYTLTLPTGAGKTLTGFKIAHEWANRFGCTSIIYALPFISIVEQTASVAKSVFGNNVQEDHSLAYSKEDEEDNYLGEKSPWNKMITLFRYWREPIVLTTLVHFWDALFNPRANQTMNFHRLSNAVIILDEPQTISPRYWQGFGQTLSYLSKKLNTIFLLMTATQPHIVEAKEIAPPNIYFPYNRHLYQAIMTPKIKVDNLADFLVENLPVYENSGLVVVNRKKAAIQIYRELDNLDLPAPILLLSGWVTPLRRRIILRYLKLLEKKKRQRYLVATQVIEAGVDLDFDWVFRDLGPLDSIIQVGGRCNRHSRKDFIGKILVAELCNEKGHSLWRWVYNDILIEKTKEVLEKHPFFNEKDVPLVVDEYYKKILEGLRNIPLFEALAEGKWGDYNKLIEEEQYNAVTVFVEENNKLIPMLKKLEENEWTLENREEQKKLMQKVMQYAIEIPIDMIRVCKSYCAKIITVDEEPAFRPVFNGQAWLLCKEAISKEGGLYSPQVGFVPPDGDWDNIF